MNYEYAFIFDKYYWCSYLNIISINFDIENCILKIGLRIDFTNFYRQTAQVAVKYETLAYIKLEEEPKISGEELLGIIGGHLGLFLGMSLLSFVELIEFVLISCARMIHSKDKNKVNALFFSKKSQATNLYRTRLISNRTREYAYRLNIAALPNTFRSRHKSLAVFWFLLFLVGLSVCIFLVVNSVFQYTSYAVTTSVLYKNNFQSKYLQISVCNIHPFNTEYAIELILFLGMSLMSFFEILELLFSIFV